MSRVSSFHIFCFGFVSQLNLRQIRFDFIDFLCLFFANWRLTSVQVKKKFNSQEETLIYGEAKKKKMKELKKDY